MPVTPGTTFVTLGGMVASKREFNLRCTECELFAVDEARQTQDRDIGVVGVHAPNADQDVEAALDAIDQLGGVRIG